MSVKELKLIGDHCTITVKKLELSSSSYEFELNINGQCDYLDRNQAHLLMLYLKEHLK
jgi:hypothetical protein